MTLVKVPCMIAIAYLFINIVLFSLFYFRALGMSYVVMQTAVENNFIPNSEAQAIKSSMQSMNSVSDGGQNGDSIAVPVVSKFAMWIDTSNSKAEKQLYNKDVSVDGYGITNTSSNVRVQYGKTIRVGIGYVYTAILPIPNKSAINYSKSWTANAIRISYRVPALKYYPDL